MRRQCVNYKESAYNYILQLVDVYSRYVMPKPLKTKSSREVAKALEEVLMVNLAPDIIQCDSGQEFKGSGVKLLLKKYNIKMINSSPYHPKSQGKCERSNRVIKLHHVVNGDLTGSKVFKILPMPLTQALKELWGVSHPLKHTME